MNNRLEEFGFEKIRAAFPALQTKVHGNELVYLDNAASTLKCLPVLQELDQHYYHETANIHRGVHFLSELGTQKYENTRELAKKFIGASSTEEIIFTKGTTEGINLVAQSWGRKYLKAGDQILVSTMEHHSNIVPWQMIAEEKGAKVIEIPILDNGELDLEAYQELFKSSKVVMVAITHSSNTLGTINPIEDIIKIAKSHNSHILIDGAQAIAHIEVDVKKLDCDFYVFSGHKMYGPTGTGILYGKKSLLNKMPPYQGGGDMIEVVSFEQTSYNVLPHKFEAGTPHIAGIIGLAKSFEFLTTIGIENIKAYEEMLLNYATEKLQAIPKLNIVGTAKLKAAVISFTVDGVHPHDLGTLLDQQGIAVRTGHHCTQPLMRRFNIPATTRASFSLYNLLSEVDKLDESLRKSIKLLS